MFSYSYAIRFATVAAGKSTQQGARGKGQLDTKTRNRYKKEIS